MKRYLVILGRKSELAFLELRTVLERTKATTKYLVFDRVDHAVILQTKEEYDLSRLIKILGGTVKVGILGTTTTTRDFMERLKDVLRNEAIGKSKLSFGISMVGNPHPNQRFLVPRELKERLTAEGVVTRYVLPSKSDELTSAQVALGGITELYVVWRDSEIEIGKTIVVQDFEGFAKRDYQRPYVDSRGGMLPPKVARMMVNLAFPSTPGPTARILDPFCGTGTIAMEAMTLNIRTLSFDHLAEKVEGTKQNLSWLAREEGLRTEWKVGQSDATKVSKAVGQTVDAIVTEPFLGPPHPNPKNLKNIIKGLNKLYLGALKDWSKCLKKGGRVVLVIPEMNVDNHSQKADLVIDRREKLGYTLVAGPLEYEREGAQVRRLIFVLERE